MVTAFMGDGQSLPLDVLCSELRTLAGHAPDTWQHTLQLYMGWPSWPVMGKVLTHVSDVGLLAYIINIKPCSPKSCMIMVR